MIDYEKEVRTLILDLPSSVKGFVFHDNTYNPCIVLNAKMPEEIRRKTYRHELEHIDRGEMDDVSYVEY